MTRSRWLSVVCSFAAAACTADQPKPAAEKEPGAGKEPAVARTAATDMRFQGPEWEALLDRAVPPGKVPRTTLEAALARVVEVNREKLGLRGLDVVFTSGSLAGNVWFLRGRLEREHIAVIGRVDCGISRPTGKVVLLRSQVPKGAAEMPLEFKHAAGDAEASVAVATGLRDRQEQDRIVRKQSKTIVFWDESAKDAPPPRLAHEVFVEHRAGDKLGGTYIVDDDKLEVLAHRPGVHELAGAAAATAAPIARDLPFRAPAGPAAAAPAVPGTVVLQVRALARTGAGGNGALTLEPMPLLDLVWGQAGMAPQLVRTDASGQLTIAAAPGDTLTTSMSGGYLFAVMPDKPFQLAVPAPPAGGGPAAFDIVDPAGQTEQLERATVYYWMAKARHDMAAITGAMPELGDLALVGCSLGGSVHCFARFNEPGMLYFSAAGGSCACYAFDTVILHEWAHALDYMCGGLHEETAINEAYADIVAMFLTRQPEIGKGFDHSGSLRSGANPGSATHGHAGMPLVGFAWGVRQTLIQGDPTAGEALANSLFLGQVGGDPPTVAEFVLRVFLADDDDADLSTPSAHQVTLRAALAANGLAALDPTP